MKIIFSGLKNASFWVLFAKYLVCAFYKFSFWDLKVLEPLRKRYFPVDMITPDRFICNKIKIRSFLK